MIVELAKLRLHRVGVTAASHKVISNLLREVCKAASESGAYCPSCAKKSERTTETDVSTRWSSRRRRTKPFSRP